MSHDTERKDGWPLLMGEAVAAEYMGLSTGIVKQLIHGGHLSEVLIPGRDGKPVRRSLIDRREIDEKAIEWRSKRTERV